MRELKYAILGMVNREPLTGYDITKGFNESLSKFWEAKHSQIYPEMRRLVDEGLVSFEVTIQGERMKKKLYSITPKGREELMDWLRQDDPLASVPKDSFRMRLYFGENLTKEERGEIITRQHKKVSERLDGLKKKRILFEEVVRTNARDYGEFLLINGAVLREQAYLEWLEDCAARLGIEIS